MSTASTRTRIAEPAPGRWQAPLLLVAAAALLAGCQGTPERRDASRATPVFIAQQEIPEDQLLDVGIQIFDSGEIDEEEDERSALSAEVRGAEARFMPVHLKHTLQRTGHWGAVRVLPSASDSVDVLVTGEIVRSDGEQLELRVEAADATGRVWFSRNYSAEVALSAYDYTVRGERDAFQDLYNAIANDLALEKVGMSPQQITAVRNVSELRFAADVAPDAFGSYVAETPEGMRVLTRLPARGDPMIVRVRRVRERDYMLVDTVNGHYDGYYDDLWEPYLSWRKFRGEEAAALRELEAQARNRKMLGIAAIAGAIALDLLVGGNSAAAARNAMVLGGAYAFKSGLDMSAQSEIHVDALRELDTSFEAEAEPMVLDVEGETVRLTGNAETQYAKWRALLKDIYLKETGLEGSEAFIVRDAAPGSTVQDLPPLP